MYVTIIQTEDRTKTMNILRRMHILNRVFTSNLKKQSEDKIILNENCGLFCKHESTFTEKSSYSE